MLTFLGLACPLTPCCHSSRTRQCGTFSQRWPRGCRSGTSRCADAANVNALVTTATPHPSATSLSKRPVATIIAGPAFVCAVCCTCDYYSIIWSVTCLPKGWLISLALTALHRFSAACQQLWLLPKAILQRLLHLWYLVRVQEARSILACHFLQCVTVSLMHLHRDLQADSDRPVRRLPHLCYLAQENIAAPYLHLCCAYSNWQGRVRSLRVLGAWTRA
jgi:hypothetical protein